MIAEACFLWYLDGFCDAANIASNQTFETEQDTYNRTHPERAGPADAVLIEHYITRTCSTVVELSEYLILGLWAPGYLRGPMYVCGSTGYLRYLPGSR